MDWCGGMRSFELPGCLVMQARLFFVCGGLLLAACSTVPLPGQNATTPPAPQCVGAEKAVPPKDADTIASLRRTVEMGPLYTIPATRSGVTACRIGYDEGVITLEYTFRDGGWLHVKRDSRIEYNDQEARFALPPTEDAVAVLTRAERAAFGDKGCGIDFKEKENQPADDDPTATETIFRGDVCNCQARFRTNTAGRVTGLLLRSAC